MSEAPERIWIDGENYYDTFNPNGKNEVEYVRADIAASQLAEALAGNAEYSRKWWQAERELLAVKAERDRWKGEYLNACRDAASFSDDLVKAEAERDRLAAEVTLLRAVARRYLDVTQEYFSDAEYDRNGCLAEAAAKLVVLLYSETARAALASATGAAK